MIKLYEWQEKAMQKINESINQKNYGCIVLSSTGSGKSFLMWKMIAERKQNTFMITVPTIALQQQHYYDIISLGVCKADEVSLIGGGSKEIPTGRVWIAVVNTLRTVNWNTPQSARDFVFSDEVHRYVSPRNMSFLCEGHFGFIIGLTATLPDDYEKRRLLQKYVGPVIYEQKLGASVTNNYVCEFEVHNIECQLSDQEKRDYMMADTGYKTLAGMFGNSFPGIMKIIKSGYRHPQFKNAIDAVEYVQTRKSIVINCESKREEVMRLVKEHQSDKIIIFDELQSNCEKLYKKMLEEGYQAVIYHSGISKKEAKEMLQSYRDGKANILLTCRALDEGLSINEAQVGIIASGNSTKRQSLQRLGRILRKKEGKLAQLYMLYCPNTIDEGYCRKRLKYIQEAMQ